MARTPSNREFVKKRTEAVRNNVRRIMEEKCLTTKEIDRVACLSEGYTSNLLNPNYEAVAFSTIGRLAMALRVSPEDLTGGLDESPESFGETGPDNIINDLVSEVAELRGEITRLRETVTNLIALWS